ncbi:MAG: hypothetical protein PVH30_12990, partial [Desulfobacterales bacterium]
MEEIRLKLPAKRIRQRLLICTLVLAAGFAGMLALASMKKSPVEAEESERAIRVDVISVAAENARVDITGYGNVIALDVVDISPEVSGRVVEVHPRLEKGETISAGEVLFRID